MIGPLLPGERVGLDFELPEGVPLTDVVLRVNWTCGWGRDHVLEKRLTTEDEADVLAGRGLTAQVGLCDCVPGVSDVEKER